MEIADDCVEATKELAADIKPINKETVHRICSGQVVLNIATAVKELVENAIDAGATLVEIKLRDQGIELIEVSDNGSGVEESNFQGLTAKYHTSKIREFTDLESVATFGFRGEALSSLCALSEMIITTRHQNANFATRLELDNNGSIQKRTVCARQTGTTVSMTNLFATLPVRKREFHKNIKREFAKMCQVLQGYCLVATGVRIICTNQNKKGIKSTVMSTNGSLSILDNITAIFGPKQKNDLIEIKLNEGDNVNENQFKLSGWISNCKHGSGRSSRDRQYFFVNARPCEPKQIIKVVNEIYQRYNGQQCPFVYLNVELARQEVDVNLTPDKRQVLVNNEQSLITVIRDHLLKLFGDVPATFNMQNLELSKMSSKGPSDNSDDENESQVKPNAKMFSNMLSQWRVTGRTDQPSQPPIVGTKKRKPSNEIEVRNMKMMKIQQYLSQEVIPKTTKQNNSFNVMSEEDDSDDDNSMDKTTLLPLSPREIREFKKRQEVIETEKSLLTPPSSLEIDVIASSQSSNEINSDTKMSTPKKPPLNDDVETIHRIDCKVVTTPNSERKLKTEKISPKSDTKMSTPKKPLLNDDVETIHRIDCKVVTTPNSERKLKTEKNSPKSVRHISVPPRSIIEEDQIFSLDNDSSNDSNNDEQLLGFKSQSTCDIETTISITIDDIKELMLNDKHRRNEVKKLNLEKLKFKAAIDPTKNKVAEQELQTEITKDKFVKMEIIGQFNLGFIIVKLNDDLFIVDQHATDEKYNFETLQKTTNMQNQPLVCPEQLDLTAVNEMILIDNIEIFEINGFKFAIDNDAVPTRKVKLIAKPFSKNWEFGKDDIDELLFMLQEAPLTICRPSRIRSMFASRACRKSVMIGTALSNTKMRRLIDQMGEIEQPWNCPHGRPTMRHLVNLTMLEDPTN